MTSKSLSLSLIELWLLVANPDILYRGKLQASSSGSILGRPPVTYICDHDTEPPGLHRHKRPQAQSDDVGIHSQCYGHYVESQTVKSDETNLLIRCLEGNKQKEVDARKKQKTEKAAELKKRPPDSAGEGSAAKRQNAGMRVPSNLCSRSGLAPLFCQNPDDAILACRHRVQQGQIHSAAIAGKGKSGALRHLETARAACQWQEG